MNYQVSPDHNFEIVKIFNIVFQKRGSQKLVQNRDHY